MTKITVLNKYTPHLNFNFHWSKKHWHVIFQAQVKIRHPISTVWSVTLSVRTRTKWSHTADTTRSWTPSWPPGSKSSHRRSRAVRPTRAFIARSRRTTTAWVVSTQCSVSVRWLRTSTVTLSDRRPLTTGSTAPTNTPPRSCLPLVRATSTCKQSSVNIVSSD